MFGFSPTVMSTATTRPATCHNDFLIVMQLDIKADCFQQHAGDTPLARVAFLRAGLQDKFSAFGVQKLAVLISAVCLDTKKNAEKTRPGYLRGPGMAAIGGGWLLCPMIME